MAANFSWVLLSAQKRNLEAFEYLSLRRHSPS